LTLEKYFGNIFHRNDLRKDQLMKIPSPQEVQELTDADEALIDRVVEAMVKKLRRKFHHGSYVTFRPRLPHGARGSRICGKLMDLFVAAGWSRTTVQREYDRKTLIRIEA
jgi:hypothetical protein